MGHIWGGKCKTVYIHPVLLVHILGKAFGIPYLHFCPTGWGYLSIVYFDFSLWHVIETLVNDP